MKRATGFLVRVVQKVLLTVLLTTLYAVGFGLTALVVRVLRLGPFRGVPAEAETFWLEAEGYDVRSEDAGHQV